MFSPTKRRGRSSAIEKTEQISVLVVSEDPVFIHTASETFRSSGVRVVGCLGPAHSRCILEEHDSCPLADRATIALVDSPATGAFTRYWKVVQSGSYAERLQRSHPDCTVILCGAPEGAAGPTGEVAHATSARSALALLHALVSNRMVESASVA